MNGKVPDLVCEEIKDLALPATEEPCAEHRGCAWQCAAPTEGRCGWPAVEDTRCTAGGQQADKDFCGQAQHLPTVEDFVVSNCLVACPKDAPVPETARVLTVNHLDKAKGSNGKKGLLAVMSDSYAKEDLVVLMTQELGSFRKYVNDEALRPLGLRLVDACALKVSGGLALFAKSGLRHLLAPKATSCEMVEGRTFAWTNTKGTAFMDVRTVRGALVMASTHGSRGGTLLTARVQEFHDVAGKLMSLRAAAEERDGRKASVFWAGDMNSRSYIVDEAALSFGTTHPTGEGVRDAHAHLTYDPTKALQQLQAGRGRDIVGSTEDGPADDGPTFAELLKSTAGGMLTEAPGMDRICPTYYKAKGPGVEEKAGYFSKEPPSWKPHWACQAPGSSVVEYYERSKWSGTNEKSRAPSWTERIFTSTDCDSVSKVIQQKDHDVLHTRCRL